VTVGSGQPGLWLFQAKGADGKGRIPAGLRLDPVAATTLNRGRRPKTPSLSESGSCLAVQRPVIHHLNSPRDPASSAPLAGVSGKMAHTPARKKKKISLTTPPGGLSLTLSIPSVGQQGPFVTSVMGNPAADLRRSCTCRPTIPCLFACAPLLKDLPGGRCPREPAECQAGLRDGSSCFSPRAKGRRVDKWSGSPSGVVGAR
jgi:hypothetical protein